MKKQILNLGKALNKAEQNQINGGSGCVQDGDVAFRGGCCNDNFVPVTGNWGVCGGPVEVEAESN